MLQKYSKFGEWKKEKKNKEKECITCMPRYFWLASMGIRLRKYSVIPESGKIGKKSMNFGDLVLSSSAAAHLLCNLGVIT